MTPEEKARQLIDAQLGAAGWLVQSKEALMIATGTDIKPLEIVFFMRSVASKNFFEQMKGRGVRVVSDTEMEPVNPGVKRKTRYLIADGNEIIDKFGGADQLGGYFQCALTPAQANCLC